jgi:chemotaxis protein methyltransferase CheR
MATAFTTASALLLVAAFLLPFALSYSAQPILQRVSVRGDEFFHATGPLHGAGILADLVTLALLVFVTDAGWHAWRRGAQRSVLVVGSASFALLGATGLQAASTAFLASRHLVPIALVVVVVAMAQELAADASRAAELSDQVVGRDRRFRQFLDGLRLPVIHLNPTGSIEATNAFASEITGRTEASLLGRHFRDLAPPGQQDQYDDALQVMATSGHRGPTELPLLDGGGEARIVSWSTVALRPAEGVPAGIIGIGTDLTVQRRAELDRDAALANTTTAVAEVHQLKARLEDEVVYLKDEMENAYGFDEIVGTSSALTYTLKRVEQVAPLHTTVLIEGETGVGKELFARAIHARSKRSARTMVKVNCAVLPPSLVEAELFGHERGAFTGADRLRRGRFELADGGTLFLDEVGELPLDLQAKLLRVLQDGQFERVGGDRTLRVDVRLIAATNRHLHEEVLGGRFREDLYYRLHVFPVTVPPLRKRKGDIPALAEAFVRRFATEQHKTIDGMPPALIDELVAYDWPGNVRELENIIERAVIGTTDGPLRLTERLRAGGGVAVPGRDGYAGTLEDVERAYILRTLEASRWRIEGDRAAAERLGLHPNTLRFRMRKLGIQRPAGGLAGRAAEPS